VTLLENKNSYVDRYYKSCTTLVVFCPLLLVQVHSVEDEVARNKRYALFFVVKRKNKPPFDFDILYIDQLL
jgi:hypothetical protein